ncbi:MAG TPA: SOS response-associated peptidase, partial [Solirubrobacteraceae bacterium]|nr:SOS response-associated peptidase [Solirubrobacteraceae bacterium]
MCGRYTNTAEPDALERRFGVGVPFREGSRRYNIAPTQTIIAIVRGEDGEPQARPMRWGLIPPWAKDAKIAYKMINARSETVDEKSAYKRLIATADRRALLLADGFYEWLRSEDKRQPRIPFRFTLADGQPFAFAGLWTPGKLEGEEIETATILTTSANSLVASVHDRMPVILAGPDAEQAWLSAELDTAAAKSLLVPYAAELMLAAPANPLVNKVGDVPEGPDLLIPPAA